jgi:hypothetical protein
MSKIDIKGVINELIPEDMCDEDIPKVILIKIFKTYISNPKSTISIKDILTPNLENIIKEYIKDSRSGLAAMHYLYNNDNNLYSNNDPVSEIQEFYYKFIKFLILNKPLMVDAIKWITNIVGSNYVNTNIRQIIRQSVTSVIVNKKIKSHNNGYYFVFRAFFLLSFEPRYTYKQILDRLKAEGAKMNDISMAAKIIGAKLGLKQLVEDGLILTNVLNEKIASELNKSINYLDYSKK